MKKRIFGRKLSRAYKSRKALYRSLVRSVILFGKITTTKAKAKSIQGLIDKCVNLAKSESLSKRRKLLSTLGNDKEAVNMLVKIAKAGFNNRKSGFTRMIKIPVRAGDSAEMIRLEWVEETVTSNKKVNKKLKKESKIKTKDK